MTDNKYGHLTVMQMLPNYQGKRKTFCLCKCDCGNEVIRNAYSLRTYSTDLTSCGCTKKEQVRRSCGKEINGMKFGRLLVLETYWDLPKPKVKCQCDCGNIGVYSKNDVQTGHTSSCGCYNKERITETSTKDWSGYVSECGVEAIAPYKQNDKGQWLWTFKCPLCNKEFVMLPIKVKNNHTTSCGCKKLSSVERIITQYLNNQSVDYVSQYSFNDCKYKYKLKFDFALLGNVKNVIGLIEYDGKQHFEPIEWFGGETAFNNSVIRDNIKNEYCKTKNIPLLRLNYMQDILEIEEQLDEFLESVTTTGGNQ